ncbi:MAG: hypothetical protein KCHDKBKB_01332 [Elusimicrobia bacterium]|nr:hypothetical protein [Elusimicrobiota bacterium]
MKKNRLTVFLVAGLAIQFFILPSTIRCEEKKTNEENPVGRIYGTPIGSDLLVNVSPYLGMNLKYVIEVYLVSNEAKDRVGAHVSACVYLPGSDRARCDDLTFALPQLTMDREKKTVMLKDQVVAKIGNYPHWAQIQNPFKLSYEIETQKTDTGFEQNEIRRVKVYLENVLAQ